MSTIHPLEKWYSGKDLQTLREYVLPTLKLAEEQGFWPVGASRKVRAALNKQRVAKKFALANERKYEHRNAQNMGLLDDINDDREHYYNSKYRGHELTHAMMFGLIPQAPKALDLVKALEPLCLNDKEREALSTARQWAEDFAPISTLLDLLDSRRPKPEYVLATLSPSVYANLSKHLGVDFTTISVPETKWEWVKMEVKGKTVEVLRGTIVWPEGTRHGCSRFCQSRAGNDQCQACGHAIKNHCNWVPLVAQTADGPISLWVGRDCARNMFNIKVDGDAIYDR